MDVVSSGRIIGVSRGCPREKERELAPRLQHPQEGIALCGHQRLLVRCLRRSARERRVTHVAGIVTTSCAQSSTVSVVTMAWDASSERWRRAAS